MTPEQELQIIELEMQLEAVEEALKHLEVIKLHVTNGITILKAAIAHITGGQA